MHLSNVGCFRINGDACTSGLITVRDVEFLLRHIALPPPVRRRQLTAVTEAQSTNDLLGRAVLSFLGRDRGTDSDTIGAFDVAAV